MVDYELEQKSVLSYGDIHRNLLQLVCDGEVDIHATSLVFARMREERQGLVLPFSRSGLQQVEGPSNEVVGLLVVSESRLSQLEIYFPKQLRKFL